MPWTQTTGSPSPSSRTTAYATGEDVPAGGAVIDEAAAIHGGSVGRWGVRRIIPMG